jgi:hypothetical protein
MPHVFGLCCIVRRQKNISILCPVLAEQGVVQVYLVLYGVSEVALKANAIVSVYFDRGQWLSTSGR